MRVWMLLGGIVGLSTLTAPALAQQATPAWRSGFETGFPGEWLDYDEGGYTANGTPNSGQTCAWTIVSRQDDPIVAIGDHAYRGWPLSTNSDVQRAYPMIHADIAAPLVNSFMVYLDVDYSALAEDEWVHFATWGNNPDWYVHTMSMRARKLEMAHLDWDYIGPTPQPDFPLRRWVRFTAYINYTAAQGTIRVWQDGVPVMQGTYTERTGTSLMRAHWGWYSSGSVVQGVQYNDEIQIWRLDAPLTDLDTEPASPYGTSGTGGGGSGGSGTGGSATGGSSMGGSATGGASMGGASTGGSGTGGSATGGSTAGGSTAGGNTGGNAPGGGSNGGASTQGGTASGAAGTAAAAGDGESSGNASPPDDEGSCECRTTGRGQASNGWLAAALGVGVAFSRRRTAPRSRA